jgi:uncharacterized protein (DUF3820 family)
MKKNKPEAVDSKKAGLCANLGTGCPIEEKKEIKKLENRIKSSKAAKEIFVSVVSSANSSPDIDFFWEKIILLISEQINKDKKTTKTDGLATKEWCKNFGIQGMPYGKYIGRSIASLFVDDPEYLHLIASNKDEFKDSLKMYLKTMTNNKVKYYEENESEESGDEVTEEAGYQDSARKINEYTGG